LGADGSNTGAISFKKSGLARPSDAAVEPSPSRQEFRSIFGRQSFIRVERARPVRSCGVRAAARLASTPPAPSQPGTSAEFIWGAIGFTGDGSYSSNWKTPSQAEAETKAARGCAQFGRGGCRVVSFSGRECLALTTFIGSYRRRRWNLSFTAGGTTCPEARNAAMGRCNADERSQGRCQPRTAACADGRRTGRFFRTR
jgi:hypothetical protein